MTKRRLPAEWEKQSGVMLTWPHLKGDWASNYEAAEETFTNIATVISSQELVLVICADDQQEHIKNKLNKTGANMTNIRFATAESNDTWARDHGPITVIENNKPLLLDFQFNGWGNKYPSDLDNAINQHLKQTGVFGNNRLDTVKFVLEGGSIESDGHGTLLTTENCLLNPSRNYNYSRQEIEDTLREQLGINRILWLSQGKLEGDDTDSHIDTLARFCDEKTIVYVSCNDPKDKHYSELMAMREQLGQLRDSVNKPYNLVPLPLPSAKYNKEGKRLPATYANFLIINNSVIVPIYNDSQDDEALSALQKCFPNRKVISIDCSALIEQFGSLHCVTMQLPEAVLE